MVASVSWRTGVVSKDFPNDWVVVCGATTPVGRALELGGRLMISGFETIGTKADPGLLRSRWVVRVLRLCGGDLFDDMA